LKNPRVKKAWRIIATVVGVLSILGGIFLAIRGRAEEGALVIVAGIILVTVWLVHP
jgi:uncharacterized membrane protein YphA (DoxX/SURF4 family)